MRRALGHLSCILVSIDVRISITRTVCSLLIEQLPYLSSWVILVQIICFLFEIRRNRSVNLRLCIAKIIEGGFSGVNSRIKQQASHHLVILFWDSPFSPCRGVLIGWPLWPLSDALLWPGFLGPLLWALLHRLLFSFAFLSLLPFLLLIGACRLKRMKDKPLFYSCI